MLVGRPDVYSIRNDKSACIQQSHWDCTWLQNARRFLVTGPSHWRFHLAVWRPVKVDHRSDRLPAFLIPNVRRSQH